MKACNSRDATKCTREAYIFITVLRNQNGPIFTQNSYTVNIFDTHQVGTNINANVRANDVDSVSTPVVGLQCGKSEDDTSRD